MGGAIRSRFIYADAALMQDAIDAMRAQQQIQRVHIADQAQAAVDAAFAQLRDGRTQNQ